MSASGWAWASGFSTTPTFPRATPTALSRRATQLLERPFSSSALSLGEVYETAEAWLDGSELGVRLAPPYVFSAGTLAAGTHTLAVEVTNTLDHEVFDIFSMTEASEPSGLLGPVALEGCVSAG